MRNLKAIELDSPPSQYSFNGSYNYVVTDRPRLVTGLEHGGKFQFYRSDVKVDSGIGTWFSHYFVEGLTGLNSIAMFCFVLLILTNLSPGDTTLILPYDNLFLSSHCT